MNDYEKMKAIEDWFLDEEVEDTTEKYPIISTAVMSMGQIRIFKTKSFTIRALIVMLQRYNPDFRILAVKYGDFLSDCPKWTPIEKFSKVYKEEERENLLDVGYKYTKEEMLRWYDYRTAINLYYIGCAREGEYPSKTPFKNVKCWKPEEYSFDVCKHPFFVSDTENTIGCDILNWYDGRRIEKYLNGEKVAGYYLTSSRIIRENEDE